MPRSLLKNGGPGMFGLTSGALTPRFAFEGDTKQFKIDSTARFDVQWELARRP
jgi:hypothetical protein